MTKETLREYRHLLQEISEQEERLAELDARATKCTTRISNDPHVQSQIHDSMAEVVAQKVDTINKINRMVSQSYMMLEEIEAAIDMLPALERRIMRLRYIDGLRWEEICCQINYGWRYTHEIHSRILRGMETPHTTAHIDVIL